MRNWKSMTRNFLRISTVLGAGLLCLKPLLADVSPPMTGPCSNTKANTILCPSVTPTAGCDTYLQPVCAGKTYVKRMSNAFGTTNNEGWNSTVANSFAECAYTVTCYWDPMGSPSGVCRESGVKNSVYYAEIYDSNLCPTP